MNFPALHSWACDSWMMAVQSHHIHVRGRDTQEGDKRKHHQGFVRSHVGPPSSSGQVKYILLRISRNLGLMEHYSVSLALFSSMHINGKNLNETPTRIHSIVAPGPGLS